MSRKHEEEIFTLDELTPKAQSTAIENYRQMMVERDSDDINDQLTEDFVVALEEQGLPVSDIRWRLSSSQGDGVAFYGSVDLNDLFAKHPKLAKFQSLADEGLEVSLEKYQAFHMYDHWNTMDVAVHDFGGMTGAQDRQAEELQKEIKELVQSVSKKLEEAGYKYLEEVYSDASVKLLISDYDQEFYADGELFFD